MTLSIFQTLCPCNRPSVRLVVHLSIGQSTHAIHTKYTYIYIYIYMENVLIIIMLLFVSSLYRHCGLYDKVMSY